MKKGKKSVSIVIPVYNAEKYLNDCVDSILRQTFDDLDIILIDDGSSDKSPKICDAYAEKDKRIQVIHKKNAGVSEARNTGIKEAKGNYICFVDSDDFLEADAIETMVKMKEKNNVDMVVCSNKEICNNNVTNNNFSPDEIGVFCIDEFVVNALKNNNHYLLNNPWNKIFDLDTIKKNNLTFNSQFNLGEDFMFNLDYLMKVKKVLVIEEPLYNYRILESGLARKKRNINYYWDNNKVLIDYLINFLKKKEIYEENKKYVNHYIINNLKYLFTVISNLDDYSEEDKELEIKRMSLQAVKEYKINFFKTSVLKDNNCLLLIKLGMFKKIRLLNKKG